MENCEHNHKNELNILKMGLGSVNDKSEVLETPQINRFNHENNVFSLAFKTAELTRMNSLILNEIDSAENLNSPSISSPNSNCLPHHTSSEHASLKCAPKKSLLFRTISQNELDVHKNDWKINQSLNDNEKNVFQASNQQIRLFDQLLINKNETINTNNNNNSNNSNKPKLVDSNNNKFQYKNNNINSSTQLNNSNLQIEKIQNQIFNDKIKNENLNLDNKISSDLIRESSKADSIISSNSASSYEDIVSSSDQTLDKKPKKRRLMELNTEARKEQIRNSNREAARRCRERKRNYIEYLEKKIKEIEAKNVELVDENISLKKLLSEHKKCGLVINKNENNIGAIMTGQQTNQLNGVPVYLTVMPTNSNQTMSPKLVNDQNLKKLYEALLTKQNLAEFQQHQNIEIK